MKVTFLKVSPPRRPPESPPDCIVYKLYTREIHRPASDDHGSEKTPTNKKAASWRLFRFEIPYASSSSSSSSSGQ